MRLFQYLLVLIGIHMSLANKPLVINDASGSVVSCINQYLQPMVNLAVDFSTDVIKCNSLTSTSESTTLNATRYTIQQNADNMCSEMQVCTKTSAESDFLNCFNSISSQISTTMFETMYSSQLLYDLKFGIMSDAKRAQALCIIEAEEKYMLNNIDSVNKINNCVQSVVGIPTPLPIVVTTTTTTTSEPATMSSELTSKNSETTVSSSTENTKTEGSSNLSPTSISVEPSALVPNPTEDTTESSTDSSSPATTHLPLSTEHVTTNSASRLQFVLFTWM